MTILDELADEWHNTVYQYKPNLFGYGHEPTSDHVL